VSTSTLEEEDEKWPRTHFEIRSAVRDSWRVCAGPRTPLAAHARPSSEESKREAGNLHVAYIWFGRRIHACPRCVFTLYVFFFKLYMVSVRLLLT